jgi:hypothetical protein
MSFLSNPILSTSFSFHAKFDLRYEQILSIANFVRCAGQPLLGAHPSSGRSGPDVHVYECFVQAHAVEADFLGGFVKHLGLHAVNAYIRRVSKQVLAVRLAAHGFVVPGAPIAAVDVDWLADTFPQLVQLIHKYGVDSGFAAAFAGKFVWFEIVHDNHL